MVDAINLSQVNFKGSTNLIEQFKAKQSGNNNVDAPQAKPVTASGAEALSVYNKAGIKPAANQNNTSIEEKVLQEFKDLTPAEPKVFDKDFIANFKGDKVTRADGTVDYYEEKNGDISKIYIAYDGKVSTAYEVNNKTGNLIREEAFNLDGKPIHVSEYYPETGIQKKYTYFKSETSKPSLVAEFNEKGDVLRNISFDKDGVTVKSVLKHDSGVDGGADVRYNFENGKLASKITENKDGYPIESVRFVDGIEAGAVSNKQYPVINTTGVDFSRIDVVPSELGNVELDITKLNGEKLFRSNNTLDKIKVKDGNIERTYQMDITGNKLSEISESVNNVPTRVMRLNVDKITNKIDVIDECNSEGKVIKSTYFNRNGNVEVVSETPSGGKNGELRSVFFYDDGKIQGYDICDDKTFDLKNVFRFDKEGNLIESEEFDSKGQSLNKYYDKVLQFVPNETENAKNAENLEWFNKLLANPNCQKEYIPQANIVHIKQKGVIDGMEYDVFSNGTVRAYSNWGNDAVIMNSNEEMIKLFNDCKANNKSV